MDHGTLPGTTSGSAAGTIPLHRLTFINEGHDVLIGRPEIDSFALFPPDGAELVRRLQAGDTVGQAADWYRAEYGEDADVDDVVEVLRSLGFVRAPDDDDADGEIVQPAVRWRRLAAVLFSTPALIGYALLAVVAIYLEVRQPTLRPAPGNFFAGKYLLVLTVVAYVAEVLGALIHESFHALSGRRLGLSSKLSLDRRLTFVVFQTTMSGLMSVPPRKRILPFCAGLLADAIGYSIMVAIAAVDVHLHGGLTALGRFALLLAYLTLLRMCWQLLIFMETDLYYVFATITHCPNLMRLTKQEVRRRMVRVLRRASRAGAAELTPTPHERRILRLYLPFVAVCGSLVLGTSALFTIPVVVEFLVRLGGGIADGGVLGAKFWDSASTAAVIAAECGILLLLVIRDRRAARAAALAASRAHLPKGAI
jgi:hypothetical protein